MSKRQLQAMRNDIVGMLCLHYQFLPLHIRQSSCVVESSHLCILFPPGLIVHPVNSASQLLCPLVLELGASGAGAPPRNPAVDMLYLAHT
jgi:hypothetical protein